MNTDKLRDLFIKYLTVDSVTKDARRKEFNQAIFDAKAGWAVFNGTDLDMVLEKFDKALKEFKRIDKPTGSGGRNEAFYSTEGKN